MSGFVRTPEIIEGNRGPAARLLNNAVIERIRLYPGGRVRVDFLDAFNSLRSEVYGE